MNILITNDDGIHADGLMALKKELEKKANVFVVAPDRPRSACGHSITLHKPLRAQKVKLSDGSYGFACSGTPSDCVSLAVLTLLEEKMDVVISGINHGPNLGWDLTYSGTVSAAMEAAIAGLPSIAVSVATYKPEVDYSIAAIVASKYAELMAVNRLSDSTLININVPAVGASEMKSIQVTRQGKRRYIGNIEKRSDPSGRDYYWLGGDLPLDQLTEGTDVFAIANNHISVTPIHLDLTDDSALSVVRSWDIDSLFFK